MTEGIHASKLKIGDIVTSAIAVLAVAALVAVAAYYLATVYGECRTAGGGPLLCWHMVGK